MPAPALSEDETQTTSTDGLIRAIGLSGATLLVIVHTPWGKQSGAHMNPAVTLTFLS